MALHVLLDVLLGLSWLVALNWVWRVADALRKLPGVPNLLDAHYDRVEEGAGDSGSAALAKVCVIVPACNEAASIADTLRSLLASEGVDIEIIAVNDRSTDATGTIMDTVAASTRNLGHKLRVLHITELPPGWLGKPHAMALAARQTSAEWLLFTDGDVIYAPDALRRSLRLAAEQRADHLVLYPTLILELFGERLIMCCVQVLAVWAVRPWKIADPGARKDSAGVGAFNLVRREVYFAVGGYEALRMEVLDDVRLGYKIKQEGYRQRVAFGRGLIRIRWAIGAGGVMRNLTKNAFAVFGYRVPVLLWACCGLMFLSLMPFAGPLFVAHSTPMRAGLLGWAPGSIELAALWALARYYQRHSGIPSGYVLTFPVGVCLTVLAMLRSMIVTLRLGGVPWRGTIYPLTELRKKVGPVR
ncbi:MAG TPA: glycosyltransferase [Acidisarcina sp.]